MDDRTPVLIGAGQYVQREATADSPMALASQASLAALRHAVHSTGLETATLAKHIDTIAVTRLFSDMGHMWACEWGRSDNPPQSIAQAIGAQPQHRIYSPVGGNQPQSMLIEFAADIARGDRDMVLIAGAEALKNQRHAARQKKAAADFSLDWSETFNEPLDDRGVGDSLATPQELANGLTNVAFYYALIEQAQRQKSGRSVEDHQAAMAQLFASFSEVAAKNPYAQFPGAQTATDIQNATPLNHLYTKRMIAQDSVNQSASVLLCSVAKARELGIPQAHFIYLHGMAEGAEHPLSQRADPALAPVANQVTDRVLNMAKVHATDIELLDIYSCFPCAVTALAEHLEIPTDGSRALTLTGGLPYFGGPGNNYSLHAMAEAVTQLRPNTDGNTNTDTGDNLSTDMGKGSAANTPARYAMVTANGGMLSKHASVIYSNCASDVNWATANTQVLNTHKPVPICTAPRTGTLVSYVLYPDTKGKVHAIIIGRTDAQEHFVASSHEPATIAAMSNDEANGCTVTVMVNGDQLSFTL